MYTGFQVSARTARHAVLIWVLDLSRILDVMMLPTLSHTFIYKFAYIIDLAVRAAKSYTMLGSFAS